MLQNILNLEGVAVLNKKQQSSINGGCSIQLNGRVWNGLSRHHVQQVMNNMSVGDSLQWCCSSCGSASWMQ